MKVGFIGDLHFRERLAYADLIEDRRMQEKEEVLDTIADSLKDHDLIVFMGDNFNSLNNLSSVVDTFMGFLSRFDGKDILILAGNHEKNSGGRTAIEFLKRVQGKKWTVVSKESDIRVYQFGEIDVLPLPFLTNAELGARSKEEASKALMKIVEKFRAKLFVGHHAVDRDFMSMFDEPLLNPKTIFNRFPISVIGHVHEPFHIEGTKRGKNATRYDFICSGASFTNKIGECKRFVWSVDFSSEDAIPLIKQIPLPVRALVEVKDPQEEDFMNIEREYGRKAIVKVEITDRKIDIEKLKKELSGRFDGRMVIARYNSERKKVREDVQGMSIEQMLEMYASQQKRSKEPFLRGFSFIK